MTHSATTKYLELGPEANRHTRRRARFSEEWQTAGLSEKTPSDCPLDLNGKFPWPNDRFVMVFSSHVMEHLANPLGFLQECHRVLKPRGVLRIAVPSIPWILERYRAGKVTLDEVLNWCRSFKPNMHRDGYDEGKLEAIFTAAGFMNVKIFDSGDSYTEIMTDSYFSTRPERTIRCEGRKT